MTLALADADVRATARADLDTLHRLYCTYYSFVYRLAVRLGVPTSAAEDVTHEVFVALTRGAAPGRIIAERAFIAGVVRNVVRDHKRAQFRHIRRAEAYAGVRDTTQVDQTPLRMDLRALLDTLPEDLRVVFVLTELEDWTAPEIAAAVRAPLSTVYARQRAARAQLKKQLDRNRAREGRRGE